MSDSTDTPEQLADFEIIRRLGAGGMAEVFLAKKKGAEGTHKTLVVKRILPAFGRSRRFRSMFIEEAQLATRLNHPNVVQVYDFFDAGSDGHILAMEYVEGLHLGQLLTAARKSAAKVDPFLAAWILAEAAKGLHYAHEKKDDGGRPLEIVHRDVSPQNILLSLEGNVKITDFGIATARVRDDDEGVIKGKFGYMSPEQARGERVDRRSDLYALGVIFWEALVGASVYGDRVEDELLAAVRRAEIAPPSAFAPNIPQDLESIVMKLLSAKPDDRFPNARDLSTALGRVLVQNQQFVDATRLEAVIHDLLPALELDAPPGARLSEEKTIAAGPRAKVQQHAAPTEVFDDPKNKHRAREVRHIVVVTLRLLTDSTGDIQDNLRSKRALARMQRMLGDIAYKHSMQWTWSGHMEARAIAGLAPKHGRAPLDAAVLALETHEAVSGYADEFSVPVEASLSIVRGIASGFRDTDGSLVEFGLESSVLQFADLLSRATPKNATWVAGGVHRLIRRDFEWGTAAEMSLEGKIESSQLPARVKLYSLLRKLSREEKEREAGDLVGRDAQLADLHAAFHAAQHAGGTGLVTSRIVVGELGIGKTALINHFLEGLENETDSQVRVFRTECTPVSLDVPFGVISELLREMVGITGAEPFAVIADKIAHAGGGSSSTDANHPMVTRLAEIATQDKKRTTSEEEGGDHKKLISGGLRSLFATIAIDTPLVLSFESFQWADRQSLEIIAELLRHPDPIAVLVLIVTRPEERMGGVLEGKVRIELEPLSGDEQVQLVESRLGVQAGVREVCSELMPRVGGNPFYLLEMVDALLERGILETHEFGEGGESVPTLVRANRGDGPLGLPTTLEQLLGGRILELPLEERRCCDWLAVAGGPLRIADLELLSGVMSDEAVGRLCARGLCERRAEQIDFRHPLTRDVAYSLLSNDARTELHAELGQHLAQTPLARGLSAAVVAKHLLRGGMTLEAAPHLLEAGESARAGHQLLLASKYFKRALHCLPPDDPRREGPLEGLETIYRALGKRSERITALAGLRRLAKTLGRPRLACLALARVARLQLDEGHLTHGVRVVESAVALAKQHSMPLLSVETESLYSEFLRELGDVQGALAACDRALSASNPILHAEFSGRTYAEVLRARGVLLRRVGRVHEAVHAYAEALAYAKKTGAKRLEARTKNALAYAMFVQGRYEDAIALALESIQLDLAMGGRFQVAKTLTNIGQSYCRLGDQPRALAYLSRAREAHERYGDHDGRADTLIVCAETALETGALAEAEDYLSAAHDLNVLSKSAYDATHENLVRGALARLAGQPEKAIRLVTEARKAAEQQSLVAYSFYGLALEASARVDAGEVHTGTLLATTALGAVETLQGCEYGIEIRALCADALKRAASPQAVEARSIAMNFARSMLDSIRDPRWRRLFVKRQVIVALFDETPSPYTMRLS